MRTPEHESPEGEGEGGHGNHSHSSSSASQHDIRGFISDFLRSVPGSKILVTSCMH